MSKGDDLVKFEKLSNQFVELFQKLPLGLADRARCQYLELALHLTKTESLRVAAVIWAKVAEVYPEKEQK